MYDKKCTKAMMTMKYVQAIKSVHPNVDLEVSEDPGLHSSYPRSPFGESPHIPDSTYYALST